MRKIIKVLQEAKGDIMVREVCRKHKITEQSFYRWRKQIRQHGGVGGSASEGGNELPMLNECVEND